MFDWTLSPDNITVAPAWRRLVECVTLDNKFYNLLFEQEVVAAPSYFHVFFLIPFLEETYIRNTIIILCNNYIAIIIMQQLIIIYGRLDDLI